MYEWMEYRVWYDFSSNSWPAYSQKLGTNLDSICFMMLRKLKSVAETNSNIISLFIVSQSTRKLLSSTVCIGIRDLVLKHVKQTVF